MRIQMANRVQSSAGVMANIVITSLLMLSTLSVATSDAEDQLCGKLKPHKQKWFSSSSTTVISSRHLTNLKSCIISCCSIPDCDAVTFTGFLSDRRTTTDFRSTTQTSRNVSGTTTAPSDNCLMFKCTGGSENCLVTEELAASDGVLSVQIVDRQPTVQTTTLEPHASSAPSDSGGLMRRNDDADVKRTTKSGNSMMTNQSDIDLDSIGRILPVEKDTDGRNGESPPEAEETSTTPISTETTSSISASWTQASTQSASGSDEGFPIRAELAPVWAIGLAVIVAIVCVGMNVALLVAYLCYRRQRVRMRGSDINRVGGGIKAPTLHAFNPTPNIQHPQRTCA